MEILEIVESLNCKITDVALMLLPGGHLVGREWEAGSLGGESGRSLKLCVSGAKKGRWADFATGESGDLLDLWAAVKGITLSAALQEVKAYLGVTDPVFVKTKEKMFRKPKPKGTFNVTEGSAVMRYLTEERKLTAEVIARYGLVELAEIGPGPTWQRQEPWKGPWIGFPSFRNGDLLGMKYLHLMRRNGKKQTLAEAGCEPTCFGWHVIAPSARSIVICEGEIDALSLCQYGFPAVSVPFGAGGGEKQQWVNYDWAELERFETVNLCMDADDEGRMAVEELVSRLGVHRCRIVTLPLKDANECLQRGITAAEIEKCFAEARYIEPEELKKASDFTHTVIEEFYPAAGKLPGFDMPWPKIPFRFLRGEVTVITGANGHGKSLLWGMVILSGALSGERACIASFEMHPRKTLARLLRQATGCKLPTKQRVADTLEWLSDKIWLFNLVGTGKVERMLQVFEYAYKRYGVRHFLVDSLMKLGLNEDDYNGQKAVMDRLCDWANSTGAHIHLIAHPRKEDECTPATKMAIKGSGAISDLAFNVFSVWRNKLKEEQMQEFNETRAVPQGKTLKDLENTPDAILVCSKSRNVEGAEGKYGLFYDTDSMQFLNSHHTPVVDFYRRYYDGPDDVEDAQAPIDGGGFTLGKHKNS